MSKKIFTPRSDKGLVLPPGVNPVNVATRTTKVTLSIGRTVNLGNYESFRMEITAESGVGNNSAPDVLDNLEKHLLKDLNERIERNVKALRS